MSKTKKNTPDLSPNHHFTMKVKWFHSFTVSFIFFLSHFLKMQTLIQLWKLFNELNYEIIHICIALPALVYIST